MQRMDQTLFAAAESQEDFWISSERPQEQVQKALAGIQRARTLIAQGSKAPEELAFEMHFVREHLIGITGQISSEEILAAIFQNFCIGK